MRRKVGNMKSKPKSIFMILITLGIIFALLPIINNVFNFNAGNSDRSTGFSDEITLDNENVRLSKISGPIYIDDDNPSFNWSIAKGAGICTGNGTYSEPYVIEDLVIDGGGSGSCIWIENSDVYFNIENCTLYNSGVNWDDSGIKLAIDVDNGQLIDNLIHDNYIGIFLESSDNNTISGNIINNSIDNGLRVWYSYNNTISGNTANHNREAGISLVETDNNTVSGNFLLNNGVGIHLDNTNYTRILNNTIEHTDGDGISFHGSSNNNWISKNFVNNNTWGISFVDQSHNNTAIDNYVHDSSAIGMEVYGDNHRILDNVITNNGHGIMISSNNNIISGNTISFNTNGIGLSGSNNIISLNTIEGNLVNMANDDGVSNQWDNGTIGNYWGDYSGKDADDDGIGDTPYIIPGAAGSQDNYPIWWDAPIVSIDSPTANATFSNTAPGYEISIEGIPQSMWYTIEGIGGNFPITELNGIIDQDTWDSLDDGDITITFYAQDSESEIGSLSIIVIKYIPNTSSTDGIPGYNLFFLFGVLSVVAIIISIKLKRIKK